MCGCCAITGRCQCRQGLAKLSTLQWPQMPRGIAELYSEQWPKLSLVQTLQGDKDVPYASFSSAHSRARAKQHASFGGSSALQHSRLPCASTLTVQSEPSARMAHMHAQPCSWHSSSSTAAATSGTRTAGCGSSACGDCTMSAADAFDAQFALQASHHAWRDIPVSEEEAFKKLHIAERFKVAVEEAERALSSLYCVV